MLSNHRYIFEKLLAAGHQVNELPLRPVKTVKQVIDQVEKTLKVKIPHFNHWK